jgi:hypothetical protein
MVRMTCIRVESRERMLTIYKDSVEATDTKVPLSAKQRHHARRKTHIMLVILAVSGPDFKLISNSGTMCSSRKNNKRFALQHYDH